MFRLMEHEGWVKNNCIILDRQLLAHIFSNLCLVTNI